MRGFGFCHAPGILDEKVIPLESSWNDIECIQVSSTVHPYDRPPSYLPQDGQHIRQADSDSDPRHRRAKRTTRAVPPTAINQQFIELPSGHGESQSSRLLHCQLG